MLCQISLVHLGHFHICSLFRIKQIAYKIAFLTVHTQNTDSLVAFLLNYR